MKSGIKRKNTNAKLAEVENASIPIEPFFAAIVYVLRTGMIWNAIPHENSAESAPLLFINDFSFGQKLDFLIASGRQDWTNTMSLKGLNGNGNRQTVVKSKLL